MATTKTPKYKPESSPFYQSTPSLTGRTLAKGWAKEVIKVIRQKLVGLSKTEKNDFKRVRQGRATLSEVGKLQAKRPPVAQP